MEPALSFASAYRQLRPAEKSFVDGYVQDVEREAARRNERISNALYRPVSGEVIAASRGMLDRPLVKAAIVERINDIAAASELTAHRVIRELMAMAFSNIADYGTVGEDGVMQWDLARCTPEQMAAVKKIKHEMDPKNPFIVRKVEIELYDKPVAIDKLMRFMGMLDPENPVWRADQARPVNPAALPSDMTTQAAGDLYSGMING